MELRTILKDKRGMGIGDLYPIVITIAIVGILLAILLLIFSEWQGATNTLTGSVANETSNNAYNMTNTTAGTDVVTKATECGFDNFAITRVTTTEDAETLVAANYTVVSSSLGTWQLTTAGAAAYNATTLNVTYSYNYGGEDCEAMASITDDFVDFIPWIGIILLIVAAAIVLGIVIKSFAGEDRV